MLDHNQDEEQPAEMHDEDEPERNVVLHSDYMRAFRNNYIRLAQPFEVNRQTLMPNGVNFDDIGIRSPEVRAFRNTHRLRYRGFVLFEAVDGMPILIYIRRETHPVTRRLVEDRLQEMRENREHIRNITLRYGHNPDNVRRQLGLRTIRFLLRNIALLEGKPLQRCSFKLSRTTSTITLKISDQPHDARRYVLGQDFHDTRIRPTPRIS